MSDNIKHNSDLDAFITSNHNNLFGAARKIAGSRHREIYSELYVHMNTYWDKFKKVPDAEKVYMCVAFMKNQTKWSNTNLDLLVDRKKHVSDIVPELCPELTYTDIRIEISAEENTKLTADYIVDLQNNFDERQIDLIIKTMLVYDSLDLMDQIIFDMYIVQNMSMRAIAERIKVSLFTSHKIVTASLKRIKQKIEDEDNVII